MKTVLIAGGSGLIGQHLSNHLQKKGYAVRILSRQKKSNSVFPTFVSDVATNYIEDNALTDVDYIINLAGDNIGSKRWSKKRKKAILESRVNSTKLLFEIVQKKNIPLKAYITASAVGYYGAITTDKIFTESDLPATDFLGQVCQKWEISSKEFSGLGVRNVQIRTGVVLTPKAGALEKMVQPIKMGFGAVLGDGKQYMPWIHIDDLCKIYEFALQKDKMHAAYNAVAPEHCTNNNFTQVLAKHLKKKIWMPALPNFVLKILLGKMADMILFGSRVSAEKVQEEGFKFEYSSLNEALRNLI